MDVTIIKNNTQFRRNHCAYCKPEIADIASMQVNQHVAQSPRRKAYPYCTLSMQIVER